MIQNPIGPTSAASPNTTFATGTGGTNIAESPVITTPAQKATDPQKRSGFLFSKKTLYLFAGVSVIGLLVAGMLSSYFLTQESQDTRQQASTSTGVATLNIDPGTSTIVGGSSQISAIKLTGNSSTQTINSIQFTANITGIVPQDFQFLASSVPGMLPADVLITNNASGGKVLEVTFESEAGQGGSLNSRGLELGNLSFSSPTNGQMSIQFSVENSKVMTADHSVDILKPPVEVLYTFVQEETARLIDEATDEAAIATNSARATLTPSPTRTPTMSPTGVVNPNTTSTPTRTPTRSPSPTIQATSKIGTPTPTPTSTRDSSLPLETQEQPVSGSISQIFFLIFGGLFFLTIGIFEWKNQSKIQKTQENDRIHS